MNPKYKIQVFGFFFAKIVRSTCIFLYFWSFRELKNSTSGHLQNIEQAFFFFMPSAVSLTTQLFWSTVAQIHRSQKTTTRMHTRLIDLKSIFESKNYCWQVDQQSLLFRKSAFLNRLICSHFMTQNVKKGSQKLQIPIHLGVLSTPRKIHRNGS